MAQVPGLKIYPENCWRPLHELETVGNESTAGGVPVKCLWAGIGGCWLVAKYGVDEVHNQQRVELFLYGDGAVMAHTVFHPWVSEAAIDCIVAGLILGLKDNANRKG